MEEEGRWTGAARPARCPTSEAQAGGPLAGAAVRDLNASDKPGGKLTKDDLPRI